MATITTLSLTPRTPLSALVSAYPASLRGSVDIIFLSLHLQTIADSLQLADKTQVEKALQESEVDLIEKV